jgi:hypothetical protein
MGIHTFPVPPGWSPEQAWEVHSRGGLLPTDEEPNWVNLEIEGGELRNGFLMGGRLVAYHDPKGA